MKKWFGKYYKRYMLIPIVEKIIVYLVLSFLAVILWDRFLNDLRIMNARQQILPFCTALLFAVAWFSFLKYGRYSRNTQLHTRKRQPKNGSFSDAVYTDPDLHAELTDEEKTLCTLAAGLVSAVVCLIVALI